MQELPVEPITLALVGRAAADLKLQVREIVLRFGVAEVRINAGTGELCDRLIQGFPGFENPAGHPLRDPAFACVHSGRENHDTPAPWMSGLGYLIELNRRM